MATATCDHSAPPTSTCLESYKLATKLGIATNTNSTNFTPQCSTCGNIQFAICCLECDFIGCPHHTVHEHKYGACLGPPLESPIWCFNCKDLISPSPSFESVRQSVLHSMICTDATASNGSTTNATSNDTSTVSFKKYSGLRGIINLGSTCYASAVLQSLVHNPLVKTFFLSGGHETEKCESPNCLTCSLDRIYTSFFGTDIVQGYGITDMLIKMAEKQPLMGAGSTEQDAHEFYLMMLSEFHRTHYNSSLGPRSDHGVECGCITHRYFTGSLQSTLHCECGANAVREESMIDLGLDLAQESNLQTSNTINECLQRFVSEELVANYTCDKCGESKKTTKRLQLAKIPPVLMIQLKRFKIFGSSSTKIESPVEFGMEIDLSPFTVTGEGKKIVYELFAVICHTGSLDTGHYTCMLKHNSGLWFHFDDVMVSQVDPNFVKQTRTAYLLLYVVKTVI